MDRLLILRDLWTRGLESRGKGLHGGQPLRVIGAAAIRGGYARSTDARVICGGVAVAIALTAESRTAQIACVTGHFRTDPLRRAVVRSAVRVVGAREGRTVYVPKTGGVSFISTRYVIATTIEILIGHCTVRHDLTSIQARGVGICRA